MVPSSGQPSKLTHERVVAAPWSPVIIIIHERKGGRSQSNGFLPLPSPFAFSGKGWQVFSFGGKESRWGQADRKYQCHSWPCSLDLVPSPKALLLCPPTLTRAGSSEAGPRSIEGSISFSYPPWWHAACTTGVGEVPTNREEPSRAERMSRSGGFCCFQHQFYFWACSQTSPTLLSAQCVSTFVLANSPF